MGESTNEGDFAQAILYTKFADMESCCIATRFPTILRMEGSPNVDNLHGTLNTFMEAEGQPKQSWSLSLLLGLQS